MGGDRSAHENNQLVGFGDSRGIRAMLISYLLVLRQILGERFYLDFGLAAAGPLIAAIGLIAGGSAHRTGSVVI